MFLDTPISSHLKNLVKRTNSHINRIKDAASTKLQLMEDVSVTMTLTLDFAFNAKTNLQQKIQNSQQQCQIFNKMEKQFAGKWPDFNNNAKTLLNVSLDFEEIKDRVCTADMCQKNCEAGRESFDTIKKSIENLMEDCLLSEETVTTHKNEIKDMYDNKSECFPPLRGHPCDQGMHKSEVYSNQNSQSRHYENCQAYNATQNLSQLHQSHHLQPSQTYISPCNQGA